MSIKPFTPDHTFWCRFITTQFRAIFWETWGNPSHMISDVVEDAEACLEMARFSLRFGVLKVSFKLINTKTTEFSMCVTSPCQDDGVAWHSIGQQTE